MEASKKRSRNDNGKPKVAKSKAPEGVDEDSSGERPEKKDEWEPPPCLKHHTVRRIFL